MSNSTWVNILENQVEFTTIYKMLPTKGNLAWEYNPLRNYRISKNMYEYQGELYTQEELTLLGISSSDAILRQKGELVDFITDELSFNPECPVQILPLYSYDGSVNLILNDGLNTPRLINTRFSTTGKDTYEIVNRKGDGDTNIYDLGEQFDIDTSLYKKVTLIPKLKLKSVSAGGNLKVGNYHFYFTYTDADGNETDFVAESGLVSLFIGQNDPTTTYTGNRNANSYKQVNFILSNIDSAYEYVLVYYSRCYAEDDLNSLLQYTKIDKKFPINNRKIANILITGYDEENEVTLTDINPIYNIVDSAKALVTAKNMLFLANVHKPEIPYKELEDLSLRFLPYLKDETYPLVMDETYNISSRNKGYYDPLYIYSNVGYWEGDLYRLGVVYILGNNELTPVFNIRGGVNIPSYDATKTIYNLYKFVNNNGRVYIQSNEETNYILPPETNESNNPTSIQIVEYENTKGVVSFNSTKDANTIHAIEIRGEKEQIERLKNLGVKGFFFVRLKRMPLTLCLGITIATDNTSHTPTIPTKNGVILDALADLENSNMEFDYDEDSNGNIVPAINYVSEGFLSHYRYKIAGEKESSWSVYGKVASVVGVVALVAAAAFFTCGAAGIALLGVSAAAGTAGAAAGISAVAGALSLLGWSGTAWVVGAAAVATIATAATSGITQATRKNRATKAHKSYKGRDSIDIPDKCVQLELDNSRRLDASFAKRLIIKGLEHNQINALICPEYDVDSAYYNQLFTGADFTLKTTRMQSTTLTDGEGYFYNNDRHFYIPSYEDVPIRYSYSAKLQAVPDDTKVVLIGNQRFRSRAGWAEEAWRYESVGGDYSSDITKINGDATESEEEDTDGNKINVEQTVGLINSDIIRGTFGPYVAMVGYGGDSCETVNIMIPGYKETAIEDYITMRMNDFTSFFAISDRIDINDLSEFRETSALANDSSASQNYSFIVHRGDCYICQFTHRINRNFVDPTALYNDEFVDPETWKKNYCPLKQELYEKINLSDVNAVQLGMWCTFRARSSMNLNVRSLDDSVTTEAARLGHPRGFYPYHGMISEGAYKSPEALIYNKGFKKSVSERLNLIQPDVPAIKNWFGTRIMYSDLLVTDAFKNNFRVFKNLNYRDYTRLYGEITKLINYNDNLFVVFEHGLALATVNEKMVAAQSSTGFAYVTTKNVLPEDLTIVSETFGSLWPESVIITPHRGDIGAVIFGVDTVGKKIWKYDSGGFKVISDFRVQEFLNNNITLSEREKTPLIGVRNVKTFYNAYKLDVLFTFYDNLAGFLECAWNLCYNLTLGKFITFYSWIPSLMENIDNIPFSFNRNTSKWITKLGASHANNSFARGIVLSNNIYSLDSTQSDIVGTLSLANNIVLTLDKNATVSYKWELCRDIWGNYRNFKILDNILKVLDPSANFCEKYYRNKAGNYYADWNSNKISYYDYHLDNVINGEIQSSTTWNDYKTYYNIIKNYPIYKAKTGIRPTLQNPINTSKLVLLLNIKCTIYATYSNDYTNNTLQGIETESVKINIGEYESTVAVTSDWNMQFLTTDFWKHGQAGLIDICDDIYPTYWYGEQHPFEFEVIVVGDPSLHKIFRNLEIVANKALPESFHYEIIGECYDFAKDKKNMYFRQEARKALFLYNGSDISYNSNFTKIQPEQQPKSAETILYYTERRDTLNEIYDSYAYRTSLNRDYSQLSGTEITYYPNRLEYRLWSHLKAVNIDSLSSESASSLLRGNCQYKEDKWYVVINPIVVAYKNEFTNGLTESTWVQAKNSTQELPRITIFNTTIPHQISSTNRVNVPDILYELYNDITNILDTTNWLDDNSIYQTSFGEGLNRKEIDLKDKFMKVRIRYSGTELAVIDFLNTLYEVSFS